jgi:3-oxoacyl-[acyl-carrier protein] reductase
MELKHAKILITGGGRGLGKYLAEQLLNDVEKVIILEKERALLSELKPSSKLVSYECDITDPGSVETIIKEIFDKEGGINVCINNAGIIHSEPLVNLLAKGDKKHNLSLWEKVINLNLNAVFYVSSNVVENMVAKRLNGVVINISSISAQGNVGQSAYSASKAGVEALSKTWSKELAMFKIRSVSIAPGFFNTASTRESLSETILQKWQKNIPLGRLGELEELLLAVKFVIVNEYFNGKTLSLDGGLTI